jgi:IclR family transcriptional regulator, KDG regulon repressor
MAGNGSVQSVGRALLVFEELASHDRGLTLTELAERTDLHKTTVHRILATLLEHRFVDRHAESGRYRVGLKVLKLGQAVRRQVAPSAIVRRHLTQLRDATGETTHYAVPAGHQMVYVEKIDSRQAVRIASEIGDHLELYRTALGKAYLAHRPEEEIAAYLQVVEFKPGTDRTLASVAELKKALLTVRKQGFAVDDRENEPEIRCVGAAVRHPSGVAIGAVSVSAPVSRQESDGDQNVAALVVKCADAIANDMFGEHL